MSLSGEPTTGVALWRRVADSIEQAIADGTYARDTRLPGELEIAEIHRVNRHTVRRALAALAERGLVRAERGSGTYVEAPRIAYPLRSRTRFSEIVGADGHEADGKLLHSSIEAASRDLAKRLGLKTGAPLLRIDALRTADRIPICVGTKWMSADRFPGGAKIYEKLRSTTKLVAHFGVRDYRRDWTKITAAIAEAGDAARLDLALGRPVLVVDSLDVEPDGRPLLTSRSRFAAERVQFVIENQ
ncbi:MAG: phosphonate metabolism transcriptional regulator PhnF [Afipia sp.]|jgi:GntR family phosphonate transport system transcriptional regulator|nr:phosphonate metabolism transcriptional regulator PhnF [Afipia sp.]MBS4002796.1 phosphonate metabolism transcriptional regulator PhnF [Afipia sp.]WIG51380.1 MAG: Transcriptional regulator PhnF [Afipia sp.]